MKKFALTAAEVNALKLARKALKRIKRAHDKLSLEEGSYSDNVIEFEDMLYDKAKVDFLGMDPLISIDS